MQRFARAGENAQVFRLQPFHLGESLDEFFLEPVGIAAALWRHVHDGLLRSIAWAKRVFIGVDNYCPGMKNIAVFRGKRCFGGDTESHRRGGCGRQLEKRPPRTIGKYLVGFHAVLLKCANILRGIVLLVYSSSKSTRIGPSGLCLTIAPNWEMI